MANNECKNENSMIYKNVPGFKKSTKPDVIILKEWLHNARGEIYFVLTIYGIHVYYGLHVIPISKYFFP